MCMVLMRRISEQHVILANNVRPFYYLFGLIADQV